MANVVGAYCSGEDLRTGDLPDPSYRTKEQYIVGAAEEIEAAIGHIYVTPIIIDENVAKNRPAILFLKKINWLLASARFILDIASAGEQEQAHAYGRLLLAEANSMIAQLTSKDLLLVGAPVIPSESEEIAYTGPVIFNEDAESLVEGFYRQRRPGPVLGESYPSMFDQVVPYGKN